MEQKIAQKIPFEQQRSECAESTKSKLCIL